MRYDGGRKSERVMELSHVKKAAVQAVLLVVGIAMLCFGVWRGETATVLSKAIKLCLECVNLRARHNSCPASGAGYRRGQSY